MPKDNKQETEKETDQDSLDPRLKGMLDAVIDDNDELASTNFHGYVADKVKNILSQDDTEE